VKTQRALFSIAVAIVAATLGADAPGAEESGTVLSPQALQEIAQVEAEIDRIEAQAIERLAVPPDNQVQRIELLGKLMLYDKQLSVNRNEACAFCHTPETGFTGPVSELNRITGSYPGSVRTRFSNRKPQSHAYAPLSPVLHYNPGQGDLVGGNFWDMRATGRRLGNPAAEQAQGPPTNPVEMGLPDIACAIYRASQRPYRAMFESVWGLQAFAIAWPGDVEHTCARPGPPAAGEPMPVHLGPIDRGRVGTTFDQMAQSIAGYEASAEVTPFTSKFDAVRAGKAQFTTQEQAGYELFRGKAQPHDVGEGTTCWPASTLIKPLWRWVELVAPIASRLNLVPQSYVTHGGAAAGQLHLFQKRVLSYRVMLATKWRLPPQDECAARHDARNTSRVQGGDTLTGGPQKLDC
jgi:cytochrome c peroxidase